MLARCCLSFAEVGTDQSRVRSIPINRSADLPDGQFGNLRVQPLCKKIHFAADPNQIYNPRHPVPLRGRITDVGRELRWARQLDSGELFVLPRYQDGLGQRSANEFLERNWLAE